MSEALDRALTVRTLLRDLSLPKWRRLTQALKALDGLLLTPSVRSIIETGIEDLNRFTDDEYPWVKQFEDYERVDDEGLQEMLNIVDETASETVAAEASRTIDALATAENKLPVDAIQEIRKHRELFIPLLIETLWQAARDAKAGNVREEDAHFFALFLLAEFQAKEALPAILEAVSLPDDLPHELFGDAVTSILARVLALLAADRPEVIDGLIANPKVNEFVRWQAAHVFLHWVRDGRLSRDEAVRRLHEHLRESLRSNDRDAANFLVSELASYAPKEAQAEIDEAFRREMVDGFLIGPEDIQQSIAEGETRIQESLDRCDPTGIDDTIEELKTWAAFAPEPPPRKPPRPPVLPTSMGSSLKEVGPPPERLFSRIGRNDPCPCGSGKKFKKCCGARR